MDKKKGTDKAVPFFLRVQMSSHRGQPCVQVLDLHFRRMQ